MLLKHMWTPATSQSVWGGRLSSGLMPLAVVTPLAALDAGSNDQIISPALDKELLYHL